MSKDTPDKPSRRPPAIVEAFQKLSEGGMPSLDWYKPSALRLARALADLQQALGPVNGAQAPLHELKRLLNLPEEVWRAAEDPKKIAFRCMLDELLSLEGTKVAFYTGPHTADDGQLKMPWAPDTSVKRRGASRPTTEVTTAPSVAGSRTGSESTFTQDAIEDQPLGHPCPSCGAQTRALYTLEEREDGTEQVLRRRFYCKCTLVNAKREAGETNPRKLELKSIVGEAIPSEEAQTPRLVALPGGKARGPE